MELDRTGGLTMSFSRPLVVLQPLPNSQHEDNSHIQTVRISTEPFTKRLLPDPSAEMCIPNGIRVVDKVPVALFFIPRRAHEFVPKLLVDEIGKVRPSLQRGLRLQGMADVT
jgi:hypothetical protein